METIQNNKKEINLEQLVDGLKRVDGRNLQLTKSFKWIMLIMVPVYFIFFLINLIMEDICMKSFEFLFFSLAFLCFALLFIRLHKDYKSVDYGVSTVEMLTKAADRYKLWQPKTYMTIVPVILMCIGVSIGMNDIVPFPDQTIRMVIVFAGYFAILCISFFVGYLIWRKQQKPLRDKALALLAEMKK